MTREFYDGDFAIRPSELPQHAGTYYRVVNEKTGEESALYTWAQCLEIIEHTKQKDLRGSFNIGG